MFWPIKFQVQYSRVCSFQDGVQLAEEKLASAVENLVRPFPLEYKKLMFMFMIMLMLMT